MRNLILVTVLSAATAPAQTICIRGLVEPAGPSTCFNAHSHMLRCANVKLRSSTVNLVQYEGQTVELCGSLVPAGTCRTLDVAAVNTPVDRLVITGPVAFRIPRGQIATFDIGITPARLWLNLMSPARGWTDLGAPGVLLLDPLRFFDFGSGVLDGTGRGGFQVQVPNDPVLVNASLYFQPVFVDLATLVPAMGNADCFTVS